MTWRSAAPTALRRTAVAVAALVVLVLAAAPVSAHSELERSDPPNGGLVPVGRDTLSLWFTEGVNVGASTFDLRTLDGVEVKTAVAEPDSGKDGFIKLGTKPLADDTYVLDWKVLSLVDGHPSSGSFLFGAGTRPVVSASAGGSLPEISELALRWVDLAGILLAIGALAVSGRVLGSLGAVNRRSVRRALLIGAGGAVAATVSGALTPFLRTHRSGVTVGEWVGETWSTLTGTPWGHLWLEREAAIVVAAVALWSWVGFGKPSPARFRVALGGLVAACWLESWAGHATNLPSGTVSAALASAAHMVAAGVWAGGLVILVVCLVPVMRRDPDARGPILASVWRSYSPMAAVASIVLLATGLYEAGRHVPDLGFLTSTVYGGAVAGKTVLVMVALTLAGVNTLVVNPRIAARVGAVLRRPDGWAPVSLRRFAVVVTAEALVLVAAAGAAAVLTSVPTAREIGTATKATSPHNVSVNGLFLTFEQVPAGASKSRLILRLRSTIQPPPAPVTGVDADLRGPQGALPTVPLQLAESGRYEAETAKPAPGKWSASLVVHRQGVPDTFAHVDWRVAAPASEAASPLQVTTTGLAILLLTGLVAVVGFYGRRRERGTPAETPAREKDVTRR